MLPDTIDTGLSLLEDDHAQINLVRWMHQCELMKRYYQSEAAFVAQRTDPVLKSLLAQPTLAENLSQALYMTIT